jgi:hypothetical protein
VGFAIKLTPENIIYLTSAIYELLQAILTTPASLEYELRHKGGPLDSAY